MSRKKKIRRKLYASLARELRDRWAPAPRNAVLLPLIDGVAMLSLFPDAAPQGYREGGSAAEFIDQISMALHAGSFGKRFRQVNSDMTEICSDDIRRGFPHTYPMARVRKNRDIEAGKRLRDTRFALGFGHRQLRRFAQLTDIDENLLAKYEAGRALVQYDYIVKLREMHGITPEWIYEGRKDKLPYDLVLKLLERTEDE